MIFSKSSGLNDSIYGKLDAPLRAFLETREKAYSQLSLADKMFKKLSIDGYGIKLGGMTSLSEEFQPIDEGGAYPENSAQEGYDKFLAAVTWLSKFAITLEMIEDAKVIDVRRLPAAGFMERYNIGREKFAASMLAGGLANTTMSYLGKSFDTTSADGVKLFSTAHTSITGNAANQSNLYANLISADTIGLMANAMQLYKDDNNDVLTITPDTIVIPDDHTMKKALWAAIGTPNEPETANNAFNYQFGNWNVIVSPYLNGLVTGNNKPFFMLDSKYNNMQDCLVWIERVPLTIRSYIDENTDNNVWKGRCRHSAGFNDWRAISIGGCPDSSATTLS